MRYLILSDAAQVEPATQIAGAVYTVVSREQALNGRAAEIASGNIVLWPDPESIAEARLWGMELARLAPEVKLIRTDLGRDMPFRLQRDIGWTFDDTLAWLQGKQDDFERVEVLTASPDPDPALYDATHKRVTRARGVAPSVNSDSTRDKRAKHRGGDSAQQDATEYPPKARTDQNSDSPDDTPLAAEADAVTHGSDEPPPGSTLGAANGLGASEPTWVQEGPPEGYTGDSRPLSPADAYLPYVSTEAAQGAAEWPAEPTDFWAESKAPEMRREWMPEPLADLFSHEAETWGSDPGIFTFFGTGICAGATPDYIRLQVKDGDPHWMRAARLWLTVCASSGSNKSPIMVAMARPLEELQDDFMARCVAAQEKHKMDMEIYEKQRGMYVNSRAKNEPAEEPLKPVPPPKDRLIIKNGTMEAFYDILAEQGERGILAIQDELVGMVTGANQYKKGGSDIEELLKLRDGGRHTIDRKGVMTQIRNFGASLIGGTQPDRIRTLTRRQDLTSNGFLQRHIFYIARDANLDLDRPSHPDFSLLSDIVERLYYMQHEGPVQFSAGAKQVRLAFREWAYYERKQPQIEDALASHLSKYNDFFAEMCLTYWAIQCAADHNAFIGKQIPVEIAERVYAMFRDCLYPHAKVFYNHVLGSNGELNAHIRYLAGKILAKNPQQISPTWIVQGWTKWRTFPEYTKRAITGALTEAGWIRSDDPRGYFEGKPIKWRVNPALQSRFPQYAEMERAYLDDLAEQRTAKMDREPGSD